MKRRRTGTAVLAALGCVVPLLLVVVGSSSGPATAHDGHDHAEDLTVPAGFQDRLAIGSITEPIAVAFAPAPDNAAFVALKTGRIKSFDYDAANGVFEPNAASTDFADLTDTVMNYWDRGLTGIAVDPQFPARPYVYVNYTYNRDPRDNPPVVPKWGDPSSEWDDCPDPANESPPVTGCLAMARVSRLTAQKLPGSKGWTMVPGSEKELLAGACFQFPSHASGDVRIGPDGYLYASFGDGASFTTEDYGQVNNPCPGDPVDEGGSLRSQDARTAGDELGVNGAIVRMNPDTGLAPDGTANNSARLVAYGQRNPWRFNFRAGTNELWSSDVGGSLAEEVNRVTVAANLTAANRGWPCYEGAYTGSVVQPGWDALDKPICEALYAEGLGAVQAPAFSYSHVASALPGASCQASTSATSGVAFAPGTGSYPAGYKGAMYFSDFARGCIWRLGIAGNGEPDPASVTTFVESAGAPVDLTAGPGGDLYYVDYGIEGETPAENAGAIHRVEYRPANRAPVSVPVATGTTGPDPQLTVTFDGTGSFDPDGGGLTYAWDLDGDGQFDDGNSPTEQRQYTQTTEVWIALRVTDPSGLVDQRSTFVRITPNNTAPSITSVTPASGNLWSVGQEIAFSATATDDHPLTDSSYTWQISIRHCPGGDCHTHPLQTYPQTRSGSFTAPDHEYPSNLVLKVTVTDASGVTASTSVELLPRPSTVRVTSTPTGVPLNIAGSDRVAPYDQTFVVGSTFNVSAPEAATVRGIRYLFAGWSDGGARSHSVVAPAAGGALTATYRPANPADLISTLTVGTRRGKLKVRVDDKLHKAPWTGQFQIDDVVRVVAPKRQVRKGVRYVFVKWKGGGPRKRDVLITDQPVVLKAVYRRVR